MPYKKCLECDKNCGPRTIMCSCGSKQFRKNVKSSSGTGKGYRRCVCDQIIPIACFRCKKCGYVFFDKKRTEETCDKDTSGLIVFEKPVHLQKKSTPPIHWLELKKGDIVKVVKGGPYYINKENKRIKMGYRGVFTVLDTKSDGILAYTKKGGFAFLYMGERKNSPCDTGTILRPYRLLVRKRNIDDKG